GPVQADRFALALQFGFVDFPFAFGCKIGARAHGERARNHAREPGQQDIFGFAGGRARHARHNAEDSPQSVIYSVDRVADPASRLLAPLVTLGQQLVQYSFRIHLGGAGWSRVVPAQQRSQFAVVVLFVLDDVIEDGGGSIVAKVFHLLTVVGDMPAFLDLQAPQGHADAARAVGHRVGLASGTPFVLRLRPGQLHDAAVPQSGVLPLGARQVP